MIIAIGELLADMVGTNNSFTAFPGGAPFNLAVNIKQAGASVCYVARVGNDLIGRFLIEETNKANFDSTQIQVDKERNTTLAFVSLKDGERDFSFYRHDTADFNLDFSSIDFSLFSSASFIHLGSLMLSEEKGRAFAFKLIEKVKTTSAKLSFDVNFRSDLFSCLEQAKNAFIPFIERADIVKFSDDELTLFTGETDLEKGVKKFAKKDKLILVTLGSKGSYYYYNGLTSIVPTKPLVPVDTTGAGDAFFGTFLAHVENKPFTNEVIENALRLANEKGALTTQFYGATKL